MGQLQIENAACRVGELAWVTSEERNQRSPGQKKKIRSTGNE